MVRTEQPTSFSRNIRRSCPVPCLHELCISSTTRIRRNDMVQQLRIWIVYADTADQWKERRAMAQKVQTLYVDDLDGSEADGTIRFGLDPSFAHGVVWLRY